MLKPLVAGLYNLGRALGLFRNADRRPRVFMYHRASVGERLLHEPTLEGFKRQLAWLAESRLIVPLGELIGAAPAGEAENRVALTFDDGFANFLDVLPLLEEHGTPATLFVTVGNLAGGCGIPWFAKVELARRGYHPERLFGPVGQVDWSKVPAAGLPGILLDLPYADFRRAVDHPPAPEDLPSDAELRASHRLLTADELCLIADSPLVEIGAHSLTHPDLTRLTDDDLRREIEEGGRILEELTGRPVRSFAYPLGRYDERVVRAVRRAGYSYAVVVEPLDPVVDGENPGLTFPRSGVYGDSIAVFKAKARGLDELRR